MTAKGFGSIPPLCDTGVKETPHLEAGIDWLTFTCGQGTFLDVYPYLIDYFEDTQLPTDTGRRFWSINITTFKGMYMNFEPRDTAPDTTPYACVSIPGSLLSSLTISQQLELCKYLRSKNVNVTRIDTKLDDYTRTASPQRAISAARAGQYSGFRKYKIVSENSSENYEKSTVYFGTRGKNGSGKYLRIYDRLNTTGGQQNAYRIEVEYTGKRSRAVFSELCNSADSIQFSERCHSAVTGAVDFVERNTSGRYDRSVRLDWWAVIVGTVPRLKVKVEKPKPVIQRTIDAFKKQWAPSFYTLFECLGNDFWTFIDGIMRDGQKRLSSFQEAWISYFKGEETTLLPDGRFIVNHSKPVQLPLY